jgi:uncharacterized membrane-anchored protein
MLKSFTWPGLIILLLVQWFVPAQMIWKKDKVLSKGISYKFVTEPIDPANPFIGRYIALNFKDDAIKLPNTNKLPTLNKVYVSFSADKDGFAKIRSLATNKPQGSDYLETTINYSSEQKDSTIIYINYPFTRYYMEEYKAPKAEKVYRERTRDTTMKAYALVNIYNGDAVIKDVYVNDSLIGDVIRKRDIVR